MLHQASGEGREVELGCFTQWTICKGIFRPQHPNTPTPNELRSDPANEHD